MTNAFVKLRLFGWLADTQGCGMYRVKSPLDALAARDLAKVRYDERMWPPDQEDGTLIIGQRVCLPGPSGIWQSLRGRRPLVFEVDDDLLNVDPTSEIAYKFFSEPGVRQRLQDNIGAADLVTVSTQPLADLMSRYNSNIRVLPNCVDESVLEIDRKPNDRITIGWGGSPTHEMDFKTAAGGLRRTMARYPDSLMKFVGVDYSSMIGNDRCISAPWISVYDHPDRYYRSIDFDIGVAPLTSHPFNSSKSHIKALEYAALGIPVVASDEPPYRDFVRHGETGFLVRQEHEWAKYLSLLAGDVDLRAQMGAAARELARKHTIQARCGLWLDAYRSVM